MAKSRRDSALFDLSVDEDIVWRRAGVSIDGELRAVVRTTGLGAGDVLASVWVPRGPHDVCIGGLSAATPPSYWESADPLPLTQPRPTVPVPAPESSTPRVTPEPELEPTPTAIPTPTPEPTPTATPHPTPQPVKLESPACAQVTGTSGAAKRLFPDHRVVAYYGVGSTSVLGVLGEGTPPEATERLLEATAAFDGFGLPTLPAFEFIATVAQANPGEDGAYTFVQPAEEVQPYLEQMRAVDGIVILDLQPGRDSFMEQVRHYEELLMEPDVHLALDPEWSMRPGGVPGRVIGSTDAATVNRVLDYLDDLVVRHGLPQKLLIVHQFQTGMIQDREAITDPPGVAVMFHIDGQGPVGAKYETYGVLSVEPPFFNGFKLFFDEDSRVLTPAEVMAIDPVPLYISYQ